LPFRVDPQTDRQAWEATLQCPMERFVLDFLQGVAEAEFLYLQREGRFMQGNLPGHLAKLEEAGYPEIEKKFKGKVPLTVCRLTDLGKAALSAYSQRIAALLKSNA
jgi:Winged helix DNA-binding domain